jgi:2,4-dienoyl-CoA reductase-like NADH-dependent reductase (Old Yellow Enzyme family)
VNGVGLVIAGCTHITPNGIGFTNEFAAFDDKFIPGLSTTHIWVSWNNGK